MPAFDGTGPAGFGPMTGWGRGPCAGGFGRGMGCGFGRGMGRRGFYGFPGRQYAAPADERELLIAEVKEAKEYLKDLEARLKELGTK